MKNNPENETSAIDVQYA